MKSSILLLGFHIGPYLIYCIYLIMSQFIFIDSRNRDYQTDPIENARYTLRDIYSNDEKDISIENVIIPCSFYSVNANNNTFVLTGTTGENVTLTAGPARKLPRV